MALQTANLSMICLPVLEDNSVNQNQPDLIKGMHLRWSFKRERGFPWGGYYLFRRESQKEITICFEKITLTDSGSFDKLSDLSPGDYVGLSLYTSAGYFLSDESIIFTDVFRPKRFVEFDLLNRNILIFFFSPSPAYKVSVKIGALNDTEVTVKFKMDDKLIRTKKEIFKKGEVKILSYEFDCITSIELMKANAVLIDLCFDSVFNMYQKGWEFIKEFMYPYPLPVNHSDYPCYTQPSNFINSQNMALDRITYGNSSDWDSNFDSLYSELREIVSGGYYGPPMYTKITNYSEAGKPPLDPKTVKLPNLSHLDLILSGCINPAVAQMVGLYFVDITAEKDKYYDYIIVGDFYGRLAKNLKDIKVLKWGLRKDIFNFDDDEVDGWIVFNQTLKINEPLEKPQNVKVFALPGITVRDEDTGTIINAGRTNTAGTIWDIALNNEVYDNKNQALTFNISRCDLGENTPDSTEPPIESYDTINEASILLGKNIPFEETETSSQFPPFRIYYYDNYLKDGWYSYRIYGIDIFGRYSELSNPSKWYQWSPEPVPSPWYYQLPESNKEIHPFAAHLLDMTSPPPPTAIEAYALDPLDHMVLKDTAYNDWMAGLNTASWYNVLTQSERDSLIGLRVKWQWTYYHMRQEPGVTSFKIYQKEENTYNSANSDSVNWDNELIQINYDSNYKEFIVSASDENNVKLEGKVSDGTGCFLTGKKLKVPAAYLLNRVRHYIEQVKLTDPSNGNSGIFTIAKVDDTLKEVTLNSQPVGFPSDIDWKIGLLLRDYEIFLPTKEGDMQNGIPDFVVDVLNPVNYDLTGVTAVKTKNSTDIESKVGAPATVYRVLRDTPPTPVSIISDSERVYATPADYYSKSYYTYRWKKSDGYKTHIYRALDESIFNVDYDKRYSNKANGSIFILDVNNASHEKYFPTDAIWTSAKKTQVTASINNLNLIADNNLSRANALVLYRALTDDTLRVLAGLDGAEKAFLQLTINPLDPTDTKYNNRPGPDDPSDYVPDTDTDIKIYIDTLPGNARNRYFYRAAYVDGAQNKGDPGLSSLPVYLPDVLPSPAPVMTKVINGDRKIQLYWAYQDIANLRRYKIYRTDNPDNTRDLRLMGSPVGDIPAQLLQVSGGIADLGSGTDIVSVERVYNAGAFNSSLNLLTGQTATNLLTAASTLTGTSVDNLNAVDGTEVVAVYTDSKGGLQYTVSGNYDNCWEDIDAQLGSSYYYVLTAIKEAEYRDTTFSVTSFTSKAVSGMPIEKEPPPAIVPTTLEWISDFGIKLHLEWSPDIELELSILKKSENSSIWKDISGWISADAGTFLGESLDYYNNNTIKIFSKRKFGKLITESAEQLLNFYN